MDPQIVAALITNAAVIYVAHMQRKTRQKVDATHDQLTVNGGKNDPPTMLDRLDALASDMRTMKLWQARHERMHLEEKLRQE